jgi:steroid delta-isomerase-like uncharacterized protein
MRGDPPHPLSTERTNARSIAATAVSTTQASKSPRRAYSVPARKEAAMGVEENRSLVLRFYEEVWNEGNVDVATEVFAEGYVRHDQRPTEALAGPRGQAKIAADFRSAFPDLRMVVDLTLAEGELVAARWTTEGTNTGAWGGRPSTGKRATFSGVNIFRFRDGKVVELWNHRDDLGLAQQLGVEIFAGAAPAEGGAVGR